MKAKDLEKVVKLHARVKELDAEVLKIEKLCKGMMDRPLKGSVVFNVPKEKKEKLEFDGDGSIRIHHGNDIHGFMSMRDMMMGAYMPGVVLSEKKETKANAFEASESDMMAMCQVLLSRRLAERDMILNHLNDLGFEL